MSRAVLPRLAALAVLICGVGLLRFGEPSRAAGASSHAAPVHLGLWVGASLAVTDQTRDLVETDQVALMEYRLGSEPPVWLAQVAGVGNRAAFHPPELCYVGSQFEVLEREPITILVGGEPQRLMRLVIAQQGERFEAWYWFTANDRVTPSYYQQQWWLILDTVRQQPVSGTLVRISTPMDTPAAARRRLLAFVTSFNAPNPQLVRHEL